MENKYCVLKVRGFSLYDTRPVGTPRVILIATTSTLPKPLPSLLGCIRACGSLNMRWNLAVKVERPSSPDKLIHRVHRNLHCNNKHCYWVQMIFCFSRGNVQNMEEKCATLLYYVKKLLTTS
jgi:hypothetical protein